MSLAIATAWLCVVARLVIDMTEVAPGAASVYESKIGQRKWQSLQGGAAMTIVMETFAPVP